MRIKIQTFLIDLNRDKLVACKDGATYWWIDRNKRHWTKNGRRHNVDRRENSQPLTGRQGSSLNEEKHHTTIYLGVKGGLVI